MLDFQLIVKRIEYFLFYVDFKKFMRWKNNKAKIMHRFQFTISVDSISKLLHSQSEYAAIWC